MSKQTKKQSKTSDIEFLKNTTAGRPMATPPGWLRNSYQDHAENLGQYANTTPTGNYQPFQPVKIKPLTVKDISYTKTKQPSFHSEDMEQFLSPDSGASISPSVTDMWNQINSELNARRSAINDIDQQLSAIYEQYHSLEKEIEKYKNVGSIPDDFKRRLEKKYADLREQIRDLNNQRFEAANDITDLKRKQEDLRSQVANDEQGRQNIPANDPQTEADMLAMQQLTYEQSLIDIDNQRKALNEQYQKNDELINRYMSVGVPSHVIKGIEEQQADLQSKLDQLALYRRDTLLEKKRIDQILEPQGNAQEETSEATDAEIEKPYSTYTGKQMLDEPDLVQYTCLDDRIYAINTEISDLDAEEKKIRAEQAEQGIEFDTAFPEEVLNSLFEINDKLKWLHEEKNRLEKQKEENLNKLSSIWDQVKSKYNEILSYINSGNDTSQDSGYQELLHEWDVLWRDYASEYKNLGDKIGWSAIPGSIPSYEELQSHDFNSNLANAEIDNQITANNELFDYYKNNLKEYQQLQEESQSLFQLEQEGEEIASLIKDGKMEKVLREYDYLDEAELLELYDNYIKGEISAVSLVTGTYIPVDTFVTTDSLLAELNELHQADADSNETSVGQIYDFVIDANESTLRKGYPGSTKFFTNGNGLINSAATATDYGRTKKMSYSYYDNLIHIKERTLLANLDTLSSLYQLNGNEAVDMNVVWLLSETGDQGRSILVEQKPEQNKVVIIDPSGVQREVYAFEVSYTPNQNEALAAYMRDSFDKEFHHTEWYEIPGLAVIGGFAKIENSIHGLAAFCVETLGGDMSEGREMLSVLLDDLEQEAGQAGGLAQQIYNIGSEILPTLFEFAVDKVLPGSSFLLDFGDNYNEGMAIMQGQENAGIKVTAYALGISVLEHGTSELLYKPLTKGAIKKATGEIIQNYGVEKYDEFISSAIECIMTPSQDELIGLIGDAVAGKNAEEQLQGSIFRFLMQRIGEGDPEMIDFVDRKIKEGTGWTDDDLAFVIGKMKGGVSAQGSIDPQTLAPYAPASQFDAVNAFGQMANDGVIQRTSDGTLQGSNFILNTSALDTSMQNALDVSGMPQTEASTPPTQEAGPILDKAGIGDAIRNNHTGPREPIGQANGQVYFTNKYEAYVSIPESVYDTIYHAGFFLFALDDGSLAITSGNEIVGFVYPDSK